MSPLIEKEDPCLNNWQLLMENMDNAFTDIDRKANAERELYTMSQGRQPASIYAARFAEKASDTDWNDSALIETYRRGPKDEVKDRLTMVEKLPNTLREYMTVSIKVDNRL